MADLTDMDFLTDLTDLARADFIGGIDNDALDFGHLEQFMQVEEQNSINANSQNNGNQLDQLCHPKLESPTTPPSLTSLPTVSTRVNLSSTPIATPHSAASATVTTLGGIGVNSQLLHAHLPESPPDSGSEPPYSPLQDTHAHGLTGLYAHGMTQQQSNELHMTPAQYTPPHQQLQQQQQQQHHGPMQNQQQSYTNHMHVPVLQEQQMRIKHESGLIMNPNGLMQQLQMSMGTTADHQILLQQQQQHQQHHQQQQQHHLIEQQQQQQQQLLFPHANNLMQQQQQQQHHHSTQFDSNVPLYSSASYQNISSMLGTSVEEDETATCMLTSSLGEATRVQVVGTSQATSLDRSSVPSTPVHSSTRKRKMSTQLEPGPEYKHDPGLSMSPLRSSHHSLGATSPLRIQLPAVSAVLVNEAPKTPAHSHCSASVSPALSNSGHSNAENSLDGNRASSVGINSAGGGGGAGSENGDANALTPCIRFSPFQPENWHKLCDQNLQELSVVYYRVDADKGFNFSVSDDAFVCQKKNHFQVTCHARLQGDAKFVKTPSGLEKIKTFHLHFYGVKLEAPNQTIRVEQSQSDRSKKPFYPVPIDLQSHIVSKVTVGRLHFSETTNNNMRKKGRPNPEQRYFQLVVGLHVHTTSGNFPIISQCSERIIVRASNPGQFESDVDLCWQRGMTQDSIFHTGRIGINTDRPDESLVVHGNLKVSGHIVQPSDSRAKQEIGELDTSVQLRNLQKIRIVRYRYEPEYALHSGLTRSSGAEAEDIVDTGVIAQEVREVIPDAVKEAGSIVLPNGNVIENFLLVNKDRILMENIGAVKELCKVTGSLESRIEHLERANNHLTRVKELEQRSMIAERVRKTAASRREGYEMCSSRTLQIVIFLLIIVMAACLAAVSTLYFVEHNKQQHNHILPEAISSDLERYRMQQNFHTFPHKNKTYSHWHSLIYSLSTTRPPAKNATGRINDELLSYNSSTEVFNMAHAGSSGGVNGNDELSVVMDKPMVNLQTLLLPKQNYRITTTAPQLRNKTITNNKNKPKWPLVQEVIRANQNAQKLTLAVRTHNAPTTAAATTTNVEQTPTIESYTSNETITEKVPSETVPLAQDFENNSIDIDAAQHIRKKTVNVAVKLGSATRNIIPVPSAAVAAVAIAAGRQTQEDAVSQEEALLDGHTADTDVTLKLSSPPIDDDDDDVVETIASISSNNSNNLAFESTSNVATVGQAIRKINAGDAVIYNVYKTVSPPTANLALTTNKVNTESTQTNVSFESTAETAKQQNNSRGEHPDAVDLQNLSNTNESVDNPITALFGFEYPGLRESSVGRRSTSQRSVEWVINKTYKAVTFGDPAACKNIDAETTVTATANHNEQCQSVCFGRQLQTQNNDRENSDSLHSVDQEIKNFQNSGEELNLDETLREPREVGDMDVSEALKLNETELLTGKAAYATDALAKQFSDEQESSEAAAAADDVLERILSQVVLSAENLDVAPKIDADFNAAVANSGATEHVQPVDCWTISTCILAVGGLNKTIDMQKFYPSLGKSLNMTYIIPLSRYLKSDTIEIHLSSSRPLQWSLCNSEQEQKGASSAISEHDVADSTGHINKEQLEMPNLLTLVKHRHNDKSIISLSIPERGYFQRNFVLRANTITDQLKLCDDSAHLANTILQYNFRILRDCD